MRSTRTLSRWLLAATCALPLIPLTTSARAQQTPTEQTTPTISDDQLDSLVAPIALYPDPLLAQVLVASTYPLELVQLQQWLAQHPDLKGDALVGAVEKESWDPSVQAMASVPDALKLLTGDIKWTTDLGNAFLAQQSNVMDAVQRMRAKAKGKGALKSSSEMKVETEVVDNKSVIVIEQANPEVVYVPSYNPTAVYGAPAYPYPAMPYPAYPVAGMAISFGVGVALGAAFHGGWGYHAGWGGNNNVNVNRNNTFVRNSERTGRSQVGSGNRWQHNPQHRGGAPYGDRATANRFGGRTSAQRPTAGTAQRPGGGGLAQQRPSGARQQPASRPGGGGGGRAGGERVGNRSVPQGGSRGGAFGGGAGGYSGRDARASSSRGRSSMGASRGASRGGGSRGGGRGGRR